LSTITQSEQFAAFECIVSISAGGTLMPIQKEAAGPKPRRQILLAMLSAY
jgi:hypothetical protein